MKRVGHRSGSAALAVGIALWLSACAGPVKPPLLLTLPAPASAAPGAGAAAAFAPAATPAPVLVLRRVGLPEYLLSRRVRYRDAASTLAEWPDTVWAERLEVGVTRTLSDALRRHLPGWTVCEGTCPDGEAGTAVLHVELMPLDLLRPQQRLRGTARTHLGAPDEAGPRWSLTQALDVPAPADTPQGHATALAQALDELAAGVARRLQARGPAD